MPRIQAVVEGPAAAFAAAPAAAFAAAPAAAFAAAPAAEVAVTPTGTNSIPALRAASSENELPADARILEQRCKRS